ncbi:MAG: hypothetical protein GFH25_541220n142 [Chloroflexi bacterium AL-N10]|nr:hypothetical protein [Chloroflexi bacterium AL-N1]NOK70150.1 hypothetical protein [Chloroflexi bacterium AL-N10]NOK77840.1 hypothetical protein [Chloroflexi bacterium AL-N5]
MRHHGNWLSRVRTLGVLIIVLSFLPFSSQIPLHAADAGNDRCTDWGTAQLYQPGDPQDVAIDDYIATVGDFPFGRESTIVQVVPQGPGSDWRALVRPGSPFAVFYTQAVGSADAINDPDSSGTNYDDDGDTVPDFAERVQHCLITSYERFKQHYSIDVDQEDAYLRYMTLDYLDPRSGTRTTEQLYPVVIRNGSRVGYVEPLSLRQPTSSGDVKVTYMQIDQSAQSGSALERGSGPWLYPYLENTVYHEIAHVVQGMYVSLQRPFDLANWWAYEGTAVYMADQSLLPTCTNDPLNPVRIAGPAFTTDCLAPNIYERDSENQLSRDVEQLFESPWLGITRDQLLRQSERSYSTVPFWYYMQAHLQRPANDPDNDVIRSYWKDQGGNDDVLRNWSKQVFPDGGWGELYHRFMIDNYLQTIPEPDGFDNPYFDSWQHWQTWTGSPWTSPDWFVQTNSQMVIEAQDQLVSLLPNSTDVLTGDNGISDIEYLGTRYYTIDPDPSVPLTSTLEVNFRLDDPANYGAYQVTFLDMVVDPATKEPQRVVRSANLYETDNNLFRIPSFGGNQRRVVVVVSKVGTAADAPFTIEASLTDTDTQPTASPDPFSPNGDGRKDTTSISYFLPPFPTNETFNEYEVFVDVVDITLPDRRILSQSQAMSETQVVTWTGALLNGEALEDGEYTLRFRAQEAPGGVPNGQVRTYDTNVTIDTVAPPTVTNLSIVTDTLTWDVVTDTSVGGFEYVIFESLNLTDDLRGMTRLGQTTSDSFSVGTTSRSRYYAVVTEDAAGNRSAPARTETVAGKVNVAIIVDDSTSMSLAKLQEGVAATSDFIANLEDGDRLALRDIADSQPHMPFTILDSTTRQEAQDTLAQYASHQRIGSPMNEAVTWALEEFDSPDVANDGRPRVLIIFSDSDWELEDAERTALNDADVRVFAVHVPAAAPDWAGSAYGGELRALVTATSDSDTDSRFYNEDDLDEVYRDITRRLRYELVDVDSESVPPGATRTFDYPIDTRTREKTIRVRWDSSGLPPEVELTDPNGTRLTSSNRIPGVLYSVSPGESVYTLDFPPLTPGLWQLHVTNVTPVLRSDQASLDAAGMDVTIEAQTDNTVTSHLQLTDQMTLTLDLLDEGQLLSRNTMVWADLVDVQGITETVVLYDDGQHGDGAAHDGRFGASLDGVVRGGGYTAYVGIQSFDQEHGYFERVIEQHLYLTNTHPDPILRRVRWKDIDGNQDSAVNPGETIHMYLDLQNIGGVHAGDVPSSLRLISGSATLSETALLYDYLPMGSINSNGPPYTFVVDPAMDPDGELVFEQVLTTTHTYTNTFRVPLGVPQLGETITYESDNEPIHIPDYSGWVRKSIDVPDTFAIGDLDVSLNITHPSVRDLVMQMKGPRRTTVIGSDIGGENANFTGTIFDDAAPLSIAEGEAPFTGRYRAEWWLSGQETTATSYDFFGDRWVFEVRDSFTRNSGTFDNWALHIRPLTPTCGLVEGGTDPCMTFTSPDVTVDEGDAVLLTIELTNPVPIATSVSYVTYEGSASDRDYEELDNKVYFAPGETRKTIRVETRSDTRVEEDETFLVRLEGSPGFVNLFYDETSEVNITIRDQPGE